jgi:hypothetical protein
VVGCKGLAQSAGVEFFYLVIGQVSKALIAVIIGSPRLGQPILELQGIGKDGHLNFIDDSTKISVEAGMQDFAEMLEVKAFIGGIVGDADPGYIALADMLDAGSTIDEVVDLAFENGLEIFLRRPATNDDGDIICPCEGSHKPGPMTSTLHRQCFPRPCVSI